MDKVFVIIVTYNGKQWYDRCFTSLRSSDIPLQIIVIDNASNDDTLVYIRSYYPEIILIESTVNLGFGQGNNKGIRYALNNGADYVFLLNQDAWIEPNTISKLVRIHHANPNYGILSPINLGVKKDKILDGFIDLLADYKNIETDWIDDLYFNRLKDVYQIKSVNAAAWLLPRKILETVGGFDPVFFHYGEDDNYLQRTHYHGFLVGICPGVTIVHDAETSKKFNEHMKSDLYKRLVLLECADINNDQMPLLYIRSQISKVISKAISLKKKILIQTFIELRYFIKMRKEIIISRNQNKQKCMSWL